MKKFRNAKENRDPLSKRLTVRHSHHEEDPDGSIRVSHQFFSHARTVTALSTHDVWALLSSSNPLLGIAKIGHRLAMAYHDPDKQAKYAMKRVDRFGGHAGLDMEIAPGDGIRYILGDTRKL